MFVNVSNESYGTQFTAFIFKFILDVDFNTFAIF